MEKTKSKSMAEEWNRLRDWYADWDLTLGDVVRRGFAVAVGLVGAGVAGALWVGCIAMFMYVGESLGYLLGGLFFAGLATFASFGMVWYVWALWTDEP